jgi:hypothetical protein
MEIAKRVSLLHPQLISYYISSFISKHLVTLFKIMANTFFFVSYEWANKLECYITVGWKGLLGTNTLSYIWANVSSFFWCDLVIYFCKSHLP